MNERMLLLPRYLLNLGFLNGLFLFFQVEIFGSEFVKVPGYPARLSLRKNTSDRKVFREIFLYRIYSIDVSSPTVIIDAGANIGLSTVYLANRFRDASVLAIEPEGSNLDVLKRNVSSYSNVFVISGALWPKDSFLKIKNLQEAKWAFSVEECDEMELGAVKGISIPTLMMEHRIEKIDLLKLDIEGSEKELFEYGTEIWLPKTKSLFIELHDWLKPGCSTSFFAAISKFSISVSIHEGMLLTINNELK